MGVALLLVILKLDLIKTENTDNTENTGARMLRRIKKKEIPKVAKTKFTWKISIKNIEMYQKFCSPYCNPRYLI